jgi:hypothetical protein
MPCNWLLIPATKLGEGPSLQKYRVSRVCWCCRTWLLWILSLCNYLRWILLQSPAHLAIHSISSSLLQQPCLLFPSFVPVRCIDSHRSRQPGLLTHSRLCRIQMESYNLLQCATAHCTHPLPLGLLPEHRLILVP